MPFPKPKSITYLNLHLGLKTLAETLSWTFGSVYFYKLGIPIPTIFLIWAMFFFIRLIVRPFCLKLLYGKNLRIYLILATAGYGLVYALLALMHSSWGWLFILVPFYALVDTVYWLVYHAYFTVSGDNTRRGREVFSRKIFTNMAALAAPLVGGLAISTYGFNATWLAGVAFGIIAAVPLWQADNVHIPSRSLFGQNFRTIDSIGFWSYLWSGFHTRGLSVAWSLVLYLAFGDIVIFGVLIAAAMLFQLVVYFILGNHLDHGRIKYAPWIGALLVAVAIIGRTFAPYTIPLVLIFSAVLTLADSFIEPVIDVFTYNASKNSGNTLWYQFFAESGWDIGSVIVLVLIAALIQAGGNLKLMLLITIFGTVFDAVVLSRYRKSRIVPA